MSPLSKLREVRDNLPSAGAENTKVREELLIEARNLTKALERDDNVIERICFQIWEPIAIRIGIDISLFKILKRSDAPKSAQELADLTGVDPLLLGRVLKLLGSYEVIYQPSDDHWGSASVSDTFAESRNEAALESCLDVLTPGWLALPDFLKQHGYRNPTHPTTTSIAKAFNRPHGASLWDVLETSPHLQAFNTYMKTFNEGHKNWTEFYPINERLVRGAKEDPEAPIMVDVGGGQGHQAIHLRTKFPHLQGRFIVEDLPQGLPKDRSGSVEFLEHNILNEQPIKGARLYYLRYVPHDWPQDVCVKFVTRLRQAMIPDYSRLIVNEWVVPTKGASKFMTAQDLNMMSIGGGMERTEELHRDCLERAGLKITGIWHAGDNISESVIEAQVM
ncbi:MAG: hypothetical protein Q9165_008609 [Trypethelium subeluteriae]